IFGTFAGGGTVAFSQNPLDFVHGEHGLSGLDIPQNWTIGFSEAVPAYRDQRGTIGHILGGWGIAGSYIISSGQPYSPTQFLLNGLYYDARFNNAFTSGAESLRPFVSNASAPASQVGIFAADACGDYVLGCTLAPNALLSLNAINASGIEKTVDSGSVRFIVNAPFANSQFGTPFGNAARNSLRDYHTNTANFTLFKQVALTERVRLMFDISFINVFNHPSFGSLGGVGIDPFVDDAGLASETVGFATPTLFSGSSSDLGQRQIHF